MSSEEEDYPTTAVILEEKHLTGRKWLGLNTSFCRQYLPRGNSNVLTLIDREDKRCTITYNGDKFGISAGWTTYLNDHPLEVGDLITFTVINGRTLRTHHIYPEERDGNAIMERNPAIALDQQGPDEAATAHQQEDKDRVDTAIVADVLLSLETVVTVEGEDAAHEQDLLDIKTVEKGKAPLDEDPEETDIQALIARKITELGKVRQREKELQEELWAANDQVKKLRIEIQDLQGKGVKPL